MTKTDSVAVLREIEREIRDLARRVADYGLAGMTGKSRLDELADRLQTSLAALSAQGEAAAWVTEELRAEIVRLNAIINSPQSGDFLRAVSTEAEHQRQRWGSSHDGGKEPPDWFWLIGYLAGKALASHLGGNVEKAEHHIITTAAACANWHRAMFGNTDMRPGIDGEAALAARTGKGEANGR